MDLNRLGKSLIDRHCQSVKLSRGGHFHNGGKFLKNGECYIPLEAQFNADHKNHEDFIPKTFSED